MNFLFVGAHTDDIEHGAGGFLSLLLRDRQHKVRYLSFSRCTDLARNHGIEQEQAAVEHYLTGQGGSVLMLNMTNRNLAAHAGEIRARLEQEKTEFDPDVIFSHWRNDIHQDHKTVADETYRIFRNRSILGYECVRSCPGFTADFYLELSEQDINDKLSLFSFYHTQQELYYTAEPVIRGQAVIRGAAIGKPLAEGFSVVRYVMKRDASWLMSL